MLGLNTYEIFGCGAGVDPDFGAIGRHVTSYAGTGGNG